MLVIRHKSLTKCNTATTMFLGAQVSKVAKMGKTLLRAFKARMAKLKKKN